FSTFTKKVLRGKRADMQKLVVAEICLLLLMLSVTTGSRCVKEERTRTGKKCSQQQLRRVDKALSRAGDIPEGSWICLSHRNLIIAEDKRCSCPSSWGHEYLTRWAGTALPNTNLGQTGVLNAESSQIKNSRPTPCSLRGSKKKVTSENKVKHTK
ncbi:unnamed protein product, partial [Porites lobata]